ncbi:MAG: PilZ domain-containing protein [Methylovulum sp.]|jgi:hypothetical protein|nr:PilZ domain-containing protein [Methylovulum sp.]MCF7999340.1 PilZ domain-containing protein [Methylovulum sp.]
MNTQQQRSYRKKLVTEGLIFIDEREWKITVLDISISGILVRINDDELLSEFKHHLLDQLPPNLVDVYLPQIKLAGEAQMVRIEQMPTEEIEIALEFQNMAYFVDHWQVKRKAYRKTMGYCGKILLNNHSYLFSSVNASVDGLMIQLAESVPVLEGTVTQLEIAALNLNGAVKIIWVDVLGETGTLLGLQYLTIQKKDIKGIPQFYDKQIEPEKM